MKTAIPLLWLCLVSTLTACNPPQHGDTPPPNIPAAQANVVSLDPQSWYLLYSAGVQLHPAPDPQGAWSFEFPSSASGGRLGYIQTPFNATTILHSVSITFRVDSNLPQYQVLGPSDILPATVHLFFEQRDDDFYDPNGRWWADAGGYNLASQDGKTLTIAVPLTPDQWTNANGQHDETAFYAAFGNVGWIGLTCGGEYFWGDGVALASGSARFVLINFRVS
jgi:hypothetical protein